MSKKIQIGDRVSNTKSAIVLIIKKDDCLFVGLFCFDRLILLLICGL